METIHSEDVYRPIAPFSQAVMVDGWLFISGTGGLDKDGRPVSEEVAAQAEAMLENVKRILEAAGMTFRDVVSVTLYLTSMDDYDVVNSVYTRYFEPPYPARTAVAVKELPAREKVKISLIAKRRSTP